MKPILLDLFCGAGGATKGYQRAGFYVWGVDIAPQPNYCGDRFTQADAFDFMCGPDGSPLDWSEVAAVHASPPCQWGTAYNRRPNHVKESPNLVEPIRELLSARRGRLFSLSWRGHPRMQRPAHVFLSRL